jgi:peptidoglycan/xylan/chitin deacetylase (PgdA/CDA1 family)
MKGKLTNWVKRVSVQSGALRLAGRFAPAAAAILMYHSVRDEPERYADSIGVGIIHATSVFERHMEFVSRRFNAVTLDEIRLFLEDGKPLPPRAVAVTFDDGFLDNVEVAAPILERFGIRAAFYLTVSIIGTKAAPWYCRLRHVFSNSGKKEWQIPGDAKRWSLTTARNREAALLAAFDYCAALAGDPLEQTIRGIETDLDVEMLNGGSAFMMDWNEARALQRNGHIVGCHTLTHPNVAQVALDVARKELVVSKHELEEELSARVAHFSYPHPALTPQWTPETVAITKEAGYETAVTTTPGTVRKGDHPHQLARIWTPRSEDEFMWNLERSFLRHPL